MICCYKSLVLFYFTLLLHTNDDTIQHKQTVRRDSMAREQEVRKQQETCRHTATYRTGVYQHDSGLFDNAHAPVCILQTPIYHNYISNQSNTKLLPVLSILSI